MCALDRLPTQGPTREARTSPARRGGVENLCCKAHLAASTPVSAIAIALFNNGEPFSPLQDDMVVDNDSDDETSPRLLSARSEPRRSEPHTLADAPSPEPAVAHAATKSTNAAAAAAPPTRHRRSSTGRGGRGCGSAGARCAGADCCRTARAGAGGASACRAPPPTGAEAVTQKYTKVIKFLRTHHAGVYFKNPVDPVKMNIPQYFDVIKNPMDLKTVLNKLEDRQYPDAASLRADVDLIWDNAILFNGEESWMKKHIDTMRPLAARKFDEAARKKEPLSAGTCAAARPLRDPRCRTVQAGERSGRQDEPEPRKSCRVVVVPRRGGRCCIGGGALLRRP